MPLTATHEEIKAYQEQVEKGKITSDGLDPCPRCKLEPGTFQDPCIPRAPFSHYCPNACGSGLCYISSFQMCALWQNIRLLSGFCNSPQTLYPANGCEVQRQLHRR